MHAIEPVDVKPRRNAWGNYPQVGWQRFVVESSDVGTERRNHRGFNHSVHKFTPSDVGRLISVVTDNTPGYRCWVFIDPLTRRNNAGRPLQA